MLWSLLTRYERSQENCLPILESVLAAWLCVFARKSAVKWNAIVLELRLASTALSPNCCKTADLHVIFGPGLILLIQNYGIVLVCHSFQKLDMNWYQTELKLAARPRGFHLVTSEIIAALPALRDFSIGWLQVFICHTSAGLTLNENADPDVRTDMETAANYLSPESLPFIHTCEGPDDMPAHVKASLFGSSVLIPIKDGRLALGTWQGIYLCEHRNRATRRKLVLTIMGQENA